MKIRNLLLTFAAATALSASAVPAKPGVVHTMTQPNGTTVQLTKVGDEHFCYYLTSDRQIVLLSDNAYRYATLDSDGMMVASSTLAHDPGQRDDMELAFVDSLDGTNARAIMTGVKTAAAMRKSEHSGIGALEITIPKTGKAVSPVILVEYQDKKFFVDDPHDYYTRQLNEKGFSDYNATGSVRDFFMDASAGKFQPTFDVLGPVTLPYDYSYYGEHTASGANDAHPEQMLLHAARLLDDEVDFSIYDQDGDGVIDSVYIIYAGRGEADGEDPNTVWPHSWYVYGTSYRFDNVRFYNYACGNELQSATLPDGIGTFCHEFSHVLGLPDLYNTANPDNYYTPMWWSILDTGCYNNNANTPPTYSSFERNALGWMDDEIVEVTGPINGELPALTTTNKAYLIPTEKASEFYLLENRQKESWDAYLPHHGMLIWHIDYLKSKWTSNIVNNVETHQYVDLVEATGKTFSTLIGLRQYPFPGSKGVTSFVYGGSPSLESWAGKDINADITDIAETDGVITFKIAGGETGIADITGDKNVSVSGRLVSARQKGDITIADSYGRTIASGSDTLEALMPAPGIYIVRTATGPHKVIVR